MAPTAFMNSNEMATGSGPANGPALAFPDLNVLHSDDDMGSFTDDTGNTVQFTESEIESPVHFTEVDTASYFQDTASEIGDGNSSEGASTIITFNGQSGQNKKLSMKMELLSEKSKNAQLELKIEVFKQQNQHFKMQVKKLKAKAQTGDTSNDTTTKLQKEEQMLSNRIQEKKLQLSEFNTFSETVEDRDRLKREKDKLQDRTWDLENELSRLKINNTTIEAVSSEEIKGLKFEIYAIKNDMNGLKSENQNLARQNSMVSRPQPQINELKTTDNALHDQFKALHTEYMQLNSLYGGLKRDNDKFKILINRQDVQIGQLTQEKREDEETIKSLHAEIEITMSLRDWHKSEHLAILENRNKDNNAREKGKKNMRNLKSEWKYLKGTNKTLNEQNKALKNVIAWAIDDLDHGVAGHRTFTCSHESLANVSDTQVLTAVRHPKDVANDLFDKMRDDQDFREVYFSIRNWEIQHTEAHEATHPRFRFTSSADLKNRFNDLDKEREVLIKYDQ